MLRHHDRALAVLGGMLCLLAAPACAPDRAQQEDGVYLERGDLPEIRRRGQLRILLPPQQARMLPRRGDLLDLDLVLARELAAELGLEPVLVTVEDRSELLRALLDGRGDLAMARLTATPARRERFAFSVALDHVRELLVTREDDDGIRRPADLAGQSVAVRASSSFHGTLERLRERVPGLVIQAVDERIDTEDILYRVARGEYRATVADEDLLEDVMRYVPGLRAAFALTSERPIAWALRPDARRLKAAVDGFLQERALTAHLGERALGGLDEIRDRKVLRVLTRNSASTYFLYRGEQLGFDFELARRFAGEIGCRLQVVVPPSADRLIPWLEEGRGDLIAAALAITPERAERIAFSRPYNRVSEVVVVSAADDSIHGPADLAGRKVAVQRSSSSYDSLRALQVQVGFLIVAAPEDLAVEELIDRVGRGELDVTIADSDTLDVELTQRDDVRGAFVLRDGKPLGWAVRPDATALLAAVDGFLDREYRGTFYNVLRAKYFGNRRRAARVAASRAAREGRISPYDALFRKYGTEVEIDWRLLAAQAYTESEFDPAAVSWAGAVGLMQVLPSTAAELGITGDLREPETNVRAGALYLRRMIDLFEPALPMAERVRFALGSYNAGRGHILDARRLAEEQGFDDRVWFGHVESVLPLLTRSAYASRSRYGYCRCLETVEYVREIHDHYAAYTRIMN